MPRGHIEEIVIDGETVSVKLGVWVSNLKQRLDKLTAVECDKELYEGGNCTCWSIERFGPPSERESYWDNL